MYVPSYLLVAFSLIFVFSSYSLVLGFFYTSTFDIFPFNTFYSALCCIRYDMRGAKEMEGDGKDEEANKQNNQRHTHIELKFKKKERIPFLPYASVSRFITHMQDTRSHALYNHTWVA